MSSHTSNINSIIESAMALSNESSYSELPRITEVRWSDQVSEIDSDEKDFLDESTKERIWYNSRELYLISHQLRDLSKMYKRRCCTSTRASEEDFIKIYGHSLRGLEMIEKGTDAYNCENVLALRAMLEGKQHAYTVSKMHANEAYQRGLLDERDADIVTNLTPHGLTEITKLMPHELTEITPSKISSRKVDQKANSFDYDTSICQVKTKKVSMNGFLRSFKSWPRKYKT